MPALYPEIKPYAAHRLAVDARHVLHVEECGRASGLPVLFLHGGPGAGCQPLHRRFFDPERYRIVLFDQRGAGQSTPHAELVDNTTWHLVADIEQIRRALGIERWVVFGGSWGSTLALAYAQTHPERVLGLVLRGIFLCRPHDIRWFYQEGASRLFPDAWEGYVAPIPEAERGDMVAAYYARLTGDDEIERMRCAKAWSVWEGTTLSLLPSASTVDQFADPHMALSLARVECHYFMHDSFLAPDQLVRDAPRLAGIPGVIVHGRYDVICPLDGAWALHKAWPGSRLEIVADAGHAASEPGIAAALVRATDELADRYA
ncbi:prolyl aminopeptidase [Plasticicumulans lactativorans]|uniref:Proline iminopeptidase n=1 Tax=Plasticicumulans lactativorans TaxID=1133106 RepID=A0A4R2L6F9_9GAMM|nr:prolyl aminopeptidase [Plasticicumulans lactativorans]TCO79546.1 prolyl aminopeptidase [Plasticicumulans lactativorans]